MCAQPLKRMSGTSAARQPGAPGALALRRPAGMVAGKGGRGGQLQQRSVAALGRAVVRVGRARGRRARQQRVQVRQRRRGHARRRVQAHAREQDACQGSWSLDRRSC